MLCLSQFKSQKEVIAQHTNIVLKQYVLKKTRNDRSKTEIWQNTVDVLDVFIIFHSRICCYTSVVNPSWLLLLEVKHFFYTELEPWERGYKPNQTLWRSKSNYNDNTLRSLLQIIDLNGLISALLTMWYCIDPRRKFSFCLPACTQSSEVSYREAVLRLAGVQCRAQGHNSRISCLSTQWARAKVFMPRDDLTTHHERGTSLHPSGILIQWQCTT